MSNTLSIMADIGGTNTRIAIADGLKIDETSIERFRNAENSGLEDVFAKYLSKRPNVMPSSACAAIAGPVRNGKGTLTNLNWTVDEALLKRATGATTTSVINDLQAQGHALEHLTTDQTILAKDGCDGGSHSARMVVGVGTGFNAAPVYRTDTVTLVPPAEVGHVDLATPTDELAGFAKQFSTKNGFCSVEDILSGRGLAHIYEWQSGQIIDPADIVAAHAAGNDQVASDTVGVFVRALGSVTGNLALTMLPFGGIYLVGGVARAVMPYLGKNGFEEAFSDKGRFTEFMKQFRVHVVDDDYAALLGMAALLDELRHGTVARD